MEGLDAAEVSINDLERTNRIDAEFYRRSMLNLDSVLDAFDTNSIPELVKVSDGNHFSISSHFVEEGVPYYRGQDVTGPFFIEQTSPICITEAAYNEKHMHRSHLKKGDVLLSIVGTVGSLSLVSYNDKATCSCKLAIFRPHSVKPEFLAVYLDSKFGSEQIQRFRRGTVQTGFLLEDSDQVLVPKLSEKFTQVIASKVKIAQSYLSDSKNGLTQTAAILGKALHISNWSPPPRLSSECRLSTVFETNRLDAEFFQEKYNSLETRLSKYFKLNPLDDLCLVTKGSTVPYSDNGDVKIIRSGDLSDISDANSFLSASSTESITYLEKGDVLISSIGFGSIGKVQVFDLDQRCGTVSEVTILRPHSINPYFLCSYLRSEAGQMQIERWITGATGQLHLYARDVKKIFVPQIGASDQIEFEELHKQSVDLKRHSKALLERAKRAVEIAIEQDEETALAYLDGKHYVADELLPKLFDMSRHYVDQETIQKTIEAEAIHYEPTTIKRYLQEWQSEGRVFNAGRGWYSDLRDEFLPDTQNPLLNSILETLKEDFPLLDFTLWSTRELTPYFHHLPSRHASYLMVDRDAFEPVADSLRDAGHRVVVHPLGEIAKSFRLDAEDTVILRPRLSSDHGEKRSPIEQILVDLYFEIDKLGLIEGAEYERLVRNISSTCRLNLTAIKRYAVRRKISPEKITQLIL